MGETFKVELTSPPDRDAVVAEVWLGENLFAELRHEAGRVRVELYFQATGKPWDVPFEDLFAALQLAKARLGSPGDQLTT